MALAYQWQLMIKMFGRHYVLLQKWQLARAHNDANGILGARIIDEKMALEIVASFLQSNFFKGRVGLS